jgi:hypothetical protein
MALMATSRWKTLFVWLYTLTSTSVAHLPMTHRRWSRSTILGHTERQQTR